MCVYAISDIRGCYDKFNQMLKLINYNINNDCLLLIGNSIDNNTDSSDMINWLINNNTNNIIVIRGRNEELLINTLEIIINSNNYNLKYQDTINSLLLKNISLIDTYSFFKKTPYLLKKKIYYTNYTFSSSGCNYKINREKYRSVKDFALNSTYEDIITESGLQGHYNIFGNYPTTIYYDSIIHKGKIVKYSINNKILVNINCGGYLPGNSGKLACICLNNLKEYYI